jgi:hypothetical protein
VRIATLLRSQELLECCGVGHLAQPLASNLAGGLGLALNIAPVPAFNALALPLFRRVQITLMSGKDTEFICDFAATFISNKRGCHPFWV